jgi:hypothetical protein
MNDTARDYQHNDPASLDGLENLFEVRELDASRDANQTQLDANNVFLEPNVDELDASWDANQDKQHSAESIVHLVFIKELQNKNEVLVFRVHFRFKCANICLS